MTVGGIILLC